MFNIFNKITVKYKKIKEKATIFTRGTEFSAGLDIYALLENKSGKICIKPHTTEMIPTGITTEMPEGTVGLIFPRSGLATKQGLRLANCVAVIDSDYRGEWFIPIHNDTNKSKYVFDKDRVAQVIFIKYPKVKLRKADKLSLTKRGIKGFGSTGSK